MLIQFPKLALRDEEKSYPLASNHVEFQSSSSCVGGHVLQMDKVTGILSLSSFLVICGLSVFMLWMDLSMPGLCLPFIDALKHTKNICFQLGMAVV